MMDDETKIQAVERLPDGAVDMSGLPINPPNIPVNYLERFRSLTLKPDFVDTICAHVANGGTLISLAEVWGVRYSDIVGHLGQNDKIRSMYEKALIDRTEWEAERLLQELRAIATVDIREAYDSSGKIKNIKDIPYNVAAAISSVESDELFIGSGKDREQIGETKKVKFWDKAKAIEMFMKKHGMLVDRHRVDVGMRLEDLVAGANDDTADMPVVVDAQVLSDSAPDVEKSSRESTEATPHPGV